MLIANAKQWDLTYEQFLSLYVFVACHVPTTRATLRFAETVRALCEKFSYDPVSCEELISPRIGLSTELADPLGSVPKDRTCCVLKHQTIKPKI